MGVRYALRPYTTIVVAEALFKNPFDMGHIVIRRYQHLGGEVGFREAKRLIAELKKAINVIVNNPVTDSPVYTYIPHLRQPLLQQPAAGQESSSQLPAGNAAPAAVNDITGEDNPSVKVMLDSALEKINVERFYGGAYSVGGSE